MDFSEFQQKFGDKDCRDCLIKIRWPEGLTCTKCKKPFYKITTRNIYECKCKRQVSLTSGTFMHGSRTPLYKWFWAIYLMIHEEDVSVRKLKDKLKVSHQTANSMLGKINNELYPNQYPKRRPKWRSRMYFSSSILVDLYQPNDPPPKEDKIIKDKIVEKLFNYIDALTS